MNTAAEQAETLDPLERAERQNSRLAGSESMNQSTEPVALATVPAARFDKARARRVADDYGFEVHFTNGAAEDGQDTICNIVVNMPADAGWIDLTWSNEGAWHVDPTFQNSNGDPELTPEQALGLAETFAKAAALAEELNNPQPEWSAEPGDMFGSAQRLTTSKCDKFEWCNAHGGPQGLDSPDWHLGVIAVVQSGGSEVRIKAIVDDAGPERKVSFELGDSDWEIKLDDLDREIFDLRIVSSGIIQTLLNARASFLLNGVAS